jgi:hypothetical protein
MSGKTTMLVHNPEQPFAGFSNTKDEWFSGLE